MQTLTLKLQDSTAKKVERVLKEFDYGTKTDFIREAIRDKLKALEKEKAWIKFQQLKGKAPVKYSDEEYRKIKEEAAEDFIKKFQAK